MRQVKTLSFSGQDIYCGIDVHKKSWSVCIRDKNFELKTFSQAPSPQILIDFLKKTYPDAKYHTVYEAGFSGYWAQRTFERQGVSCLVIHPADVPTSEKDRQQKTDHVDCRKLCRSLCDNTIHGIFIPEEKQVEDRDILRTRKLIVKDQTRNKNRIMSFLNFYGLVIPEGYKQSTHFSNVFVKWLEDLPLGPSAKVSLNLKINALKQGRLQLLDANRYIRALSKSESYKTQVELLRTIQGVGLINSMIILTELGDINRFKGLDQLANYVGLTPNIYASGEVMHVKGITHRCNHILREALVESAWYAVRKDPALGMAYNEYLKRMDANKAIIKIAKKLLNRIRYVLRNQKPYIHGIVQ